MQSYNKVVKGKLTFKGSVSAVQNSKPKVKELTPVEVVPEKVNEEDDQEDEEIQILNGTGRITSSGITVTGHYCKFLEELAPGDAILITHPTSLQEETKIVRMVLSNMSIGISSAFSSDLVSTTSFKYIKAPKQMSKVTPEEDAATKKRKSDAVEESAFGTYASAGGEKIVYRVKKPGAFGGYSIVKESSGGQLSREELLDLRSKKKADRHCY